MLILDSIESVDSSFASSEVDLLSLVDDDKILDKRLVMSASSDLAEVELLFEVLEPLPNPKRPGRPAPKWTEASEP